MFANFRSADTQIALHLVVSFNCDPEMLNRSQTLNALQVSLCLVLLIVAGTAIAQSGRRVRKPVLEPVPTPEPTPTPTPELKPRLTFIVGIDRYGSFSYIPRAAYDGALRSCADRLGDSPSVKAEISERDMGRGAAIERAKGEKEAYVTWLEVRPDMSGVDNRSGDNLSQTVWIDYFVFAPVTGKIIKAGQTYTGYRSRGILSRRRSDVYGDEALNQAAREAAERILEHFKIHLPRDRFR